MKCPFCGFVESKVIDSRPANDYKKIKRRRECMSCGKRFITYEEVEFAPLVVVKKDGSIETFNRNKLLSGLLRACEKRPVSIDALQKIVSDIESTLQCTLKSEVRSDVIGEYAMDKLKDLDEIAYVRFASVYRQFKDINMFMEELKKLMRKS